MRKAQLSSTVLDYYYKYGQNRDLEKYLRVRRQSCSKSSSDSSLHNFERSHGVSDVNTQTLSKSLEKLSLSKSKDDNRKDAASTSAGKADKEPEKKDNSKDRIKIEKKTQQNFKKKSKSKSFNVNLESSVEVNLPSSYYGVPVDPPPPPPLPPKEIPKLTLESCETQTELLSPIPNDSDLPRRIENVSLTIAESKTPVKTDEIIAETSPASSVASAKVRLEWDSMADVGYNRIIDFKSHSNTNLSTFERNALRKFFAQKGLNFDDNLIIVASPDKRNSLHKGKLAKSAVEMRKMNADDNWQPYPENELKKKATGKSKKLSPRAMKENWQTALSKYRQKYSNSEKGSDHAVTSNTSDSLQVSSLSAPQSHSTPLAEATAKGAVPKNVPGRSISVASEAKVAIDEKSCQTSAIGVDVKAVQVDEPLQQRVSRSIQIDSGTMTREASNNESESVQSDDKEATSVTSFEFMSANAYEKQDLVNCPPDAVRKSPITEDADVIPHRDDLTHENVYIHAENSDDKENVPPVEDKENIPPPTLAQMHFEMKDGFVTPEPEPEHKVLTSNESTLLPTDLQKGIELLSALVDSKKIDTAAKKKLMKKVVKRLLQLKNPKDIVDLLTSRSEKCEQKDRTSDTSPSLWSNKRSPSPSKNTISGVSALSESTEKACSTGKTCQAITSNKPEVSTSPKSAKNSVDIDKQLIVRDWLLPATRSEIEREKQRRAKLLEQQIQIETNLRDACVESEKADQHEMAAERMSEALELERRTQFQWIEQEIEHLNNLKKILKTGGKHDTAGSSSDRLDSDKRSLKTSSPEKVKSNVYVNCGRISNNSNRNRVPNQTSTSATDSSKESGRKTDQSSSISSETKRQWIHKTTFETSRTLSESDELLRRRISSKVKNKKVSEPTIELPEWNSHLNMQQLVKNRMKMQTPSSEESIEAYAQARRAAFNEKYAKTHGMLYSKAINVPNAMNEQPIYTKPYSTDQYSELRLDRAIVKSKPNNIADAYTSITGSDGFLSSNSISIAVGANSTSNTTTHQYDTKISVGVQTSDTLKRTQPIQLRKPEKKPEPNEQKTLSPPTTVRVNKLTANQQIQIRPEALAYVITFKDRVNQSIARERCKERNNKYYENSSSTNSNNSRSRRRSSSANRRRLQAKSASFSSGSDADTYSSDDGYTLQEYLRKRRPDFCASAEERRKCVNELHNLRERRNEQRKKILALNNTSRSLKSQMKRLLPPPPLAQMRIFTSHDIRTSTRRKYRQLPEVRRQQHMEKENKIRRSHRLLADQFNKKLQRRVLTGKTDLSNSMTIN